MSNPFRAGTERSLAVRPSVVVIFGASGDLTGRKLVPALYNLAVDGLLPTHFSLVGFARREQSDEKFRSVLHDAVATFSRRKPIDESVFSEFAKHTYYVSSAFDSAEGYKRLREVLDKVDAAEGQRCDRLYYFATSPDYFEVVAKNLHAVGLLNEEDGRGARVIVEKPFGRDLLSAQVLNRALLSCMREEQIFRIDHYLGKETVQNLLVFRFANGIFEPIWNHKYIEHVEISVCESIGVGNRAGYFDQAGILRDIVQNHALQLLCLVALEPPVAFDADAVRDEKVKVLRSIRRIPEDEVGRKVVRARYQAGSVAGESVKGYLAEEGVSRDSSTETYVGLELAIDNWRWAGVPFYVRAGKRLSKRVTDISIFFRKAPHTLFQGEDVDVLRSNVLSFQIQPDEGISLKMSCKPPGPKVRVQQVQMDFSYGTSFGVEPPEAYERLILDCMRGDATLFTRDDEIEEAWDLLSPIFNVWSEKGSRCPVYGYDAGSWGPKAAEEMIANTFGRGWRRL